MTSKVYGTAAEAVADITDGATLAVGGFGLCGIPDELIAAVAGSPATGLEVYSNNCGVDGVGLGVLLGLGRIRRVTASYVGENKEFARQYLSGELEVELTPQGTLAERLRAGGAGIPAFYTPAAVDGTVAVASPPKEIRVFNGKRYVLEQAINADFALVHAKRGDTAGNLVFNKTAMNFNPLAAMAGRITIAQVEELVEPGEIDPGAVHLAGVFVQRIVHTGPQDKKIEKIIVREKRNDGGLLDGLKQIRGGSFGFFAGFFCQCAHC